MDTLATLHQPAVLQLDEKIRNLPVLSRQETIDLFAQNLTMSQVKDNALFKLKAKFLLIPAKEQAGLKEDILASLNSANKGILGLVDFLKEKNDAVQILEDDYVNEKADSADGAPQFMIRPSAKHFADDGDFHFNEDDEKYIAAFGALETGESQHSFEQEIILIKRDSGLKFVDPILDKRFESVILSFLKGVRKDIQVLDLMQNSIERGGLGLSYAGAMKVLHLAEAQIKFRNALGIKRLNQKDELHLKKERKIAADNIFGGANLPDILRKDYEAQKESRGKNAQKDSSDTAGDARMAPLFRHISISKEQIERAQKDSKLDNPLIPKLGLLRTTESLVTNKVPQPPEPSERKERQSNKAEPPKKPNIAEAKEYRPFSAQSAAVQDFPRKNHPAPEHAKKAGPKEEKSKESFFGRLRLSHFSLGKLKKKLNGFRVKKKEQKIITPQTEEPQALPVKKKITDVSPPPSLVLHRPRDKDTTVEPEGSLLAQHKLVGPLDELSSITVDDLRSQYSESNDEGVLIYSAKAGKIFENQLIAKINVLGKQFIEMRLKAVDAWQRSPLNKQYVALGIESLEKGESIEDLVAHKIGNGEPTLNAEEFNLLSDINAHLRLLH